MEKTRIRPITNGKSMRMSYSRQKEVLQMPNLIEVQTDSYKWLDVYKRQLQQGTGWLNVRRTCWHIT